MLRVSGSGVCRGSLGLFHERNEPRNHWHLQVDGILWLSQGARVDSTIYSIYQDVPVVNRIR